MPEQKMRKGKTIEVTEDSYFTISKYLFSSDQPSVFRSMKIAKGTRGKVTSVKGNCAEVRITFGPFVFNARISKNNLRVVKTTL